MHTPEVRKDVLGGALTCVLGILTVGIGIYFLILRPPLLPEDLRHTGIDPTALPPAFVDWLHIVFSTWGGFIAGFGATLLGIGLFMLSGRKLWLYLGTAAGALVAFGRFLLSNIIINSDSLWLIAGFFALALTLSLVLVAKTVRPLRRKRRGTPASRNPVES